MCRVWIVVLRVLRCRPKLLTVGVSFAADPETALAAFARSVGKKGDIWEGVEKNDDGHIVKIDWDGKGLDGTLPTAGDLLDMLFLRNLDLRNNSKLKGRATESQLCCKHCYEFRGGNMAATRKKELRHHRKRHAHFCDF